MQLVVPRDLFKLQVISPVTQLVAIKQAAQMDSQLGRKRACGLEQEKTPARKRLRFVAAPRQASFPVDMARQMATFRFAGSPKRKSYIPKRHKTGWCAHQR